MKSIGIFWKSNHDEDDYCQRCPHGKDKVRETNENCPSKDELFEFQINLWNTDVINVANNDRHRFRAIDFGIICPLSTRKLVFLLPFKVDKSAFHDLVKCLSLDTDLLCTVFNEDLKSTSEPAKSYHKIESPNIHLLMYELSKENIESLVYDDAVDVTEMTISINTNFEDEKLNDYQLFIRFRLKLNSFDSFAKKKRISNDWLQSAFSSTYMFDIRLNDVRELSKKKKELVEFKGYQLPVFKKIHFFYMADSEENVENGSAMTLDKRLLEKERWHSYLGENIVFASENIAHHWKSKMKTPFKLEKVNVIDGKQSKEEFVSDEKFILNFTLFFKTEFSDYQFSRILLYAIIVVILGSLASAIISLIGSFIPHDLRLERFVWGLVVFCTTILVVFGLYKSSNKYKR